MGRKRTFQNHVTLVACGVLWAATAAVANGQAGTWKWQKVTNMDKSAAVLGSVARGDDGTVYACSLNGLLYAVDPNANTGYNGGFKWTFDTGLIAGWTPAIADDGTIIVNATFALYGVNPNGTEKWHLWGSCSDRFYGNPAIAKDGTVYIGKTANGLYAIDSNGSVKWTFAVPKDQYTRDPVIGRDGVVYFGTKPATGSQWNQYCFYAVYPDGTLKWKFPYWSLKGMTAPPAIGNSGTIYFGIDDIDGPFPRLLGLRPADGSIEAVFTGVGSLGGNYTSPPCIDWDGTIYIPFHAAMHAFRPDGTQIMNGEFPGHPASAAVADDGKVYFSIPHVDEIHCIQPIPSSSKPGWLDTNPQWMMPPTTGHNGGSSPLIGHDNSICIGSEICINAINIDSSGPANSPWPMHRANRKRNARVDKYFMSMQSIKFLIKELAYTEMDLEVKKRTSLGLQLELAVEALEDEAPADAMELLTAFVADIESLGRSMSQRDVEYLLKQVDATLEQIIGEFVLTDDRPIVRETVDTRVRSLGGMEAEEGQARLRR